MARFVGLFILVFLICSQHVGCIAMSSTAISAMSSSSSSLNVGDISSTTVGTPSASATDSEPYLHIPLRTGAPDTIGFESVNGFYGPGAWAGWFLLICASWIRLFREPRVFDFNFWAYLLAMNWAAIELMRNVRQLMDLKAAGAVDWMQNCATIGAAMNVVIWGQFHAVVQLLTDSIRRFIKDDEVTWQRFATTMVGLFLPTLALTIAGLGLFGPEGSQIQNVTPTLYWDGMLSNDGKSHDIIDSRGWAHDKALSIAMIVGPTWFTWTVEVAIAATISGLWYIASDSGKNMVKRVWDGMMDWRYMGWYAFSSIFFGLTIIIAWGLYELWWLRLILIPFLPIYLAFGLFLSLYISVCSLLGHAVLIWYSMAYVWKAYVARTVPISESCFFMPCSPHDISQGDQAFALLAGLFALVVAEVGYPFYQSMKRRRREEARFQAETERRIELGRLTRDIATSTATSTAADDLWAVRRTNSGIAAEEGRAGERLSGLRRTELTTSTIGE
jgi:hypothetical protein